MFYYYLTFIYYYLISNLVPAYFQFFNIFKNVILKIIHLKIFVCFILVQGVLSSQKAEKCFLDFDSGPDEEFTINYWFNKTAGQCESFWYGGSGGNENRFENLDDCINICDSGKVR